MEFSEKQRLAMTWWNRESTRSYEGIICDGAIRSGKTLALSCGFFLWSMATFQDGVFGLCSKTVGAFRRNVLLPLQGYLGSRFRIRENRSENKLTVYLGNRKNTYYIFGGQDEGAASLIQGITLWGVLFDEAALMPKSFVQQACARCSVAGSKLWFNCNPGSQEHWFYKEFILQAEEKGFFHLPFTMADNPALPPEVKLRYEKMYTGVFYDRYILGKWCQSEGLIYDFSPEKHIFSVPPAGGQYYISVDYGTQNPFSAGLWCVTEGKAYRLKEYYHNGRQQGAKTDQEYYEALLELAGDRPITHLFIDPSAASLITLIRKHRRFPLRKADNRVLPGIRLVGGLLKQGRLLIGENCRDCIREFGLYTWQEEADAPVKENDHAMDDVRYFAMGAMARSL